MNDLTGARLEPGAVALVGGGPGAWDLITVRGLDLLRQADVVVADRLGPRALLDELGADVEVIDVGKRPGAHSMRQDDIGALLVALAREGRRVVRLKGGDPFVLGRGGEEVLACRAAGIDVQVVPGVTSALAGPAAGDVPVTHRGTAVAVHVVNAHGDLGPADLAALADPGTTTVLMMGVEWLPRLVAQALLNGIDPATPVAVVQEATLPGQRQVRGTLADIEQVVAEAGIGHPAVIAVGRTAAEGFLRPEQPAAAAEAPEHGSGREAVDLPEHGPGPGPSPAPVLIGCSHGTRSREGRDVLRALLRRIAAQAPGA
ncbi:MAG: uroporphyrinogen-III C-methyltransferase, partial [Brachybacterium paraconglomeratum]|nr:uroporphyrinogen-III C-methyltransferase [Brachybacterium paraconglomeratum]